MSNNITMDVLMLENHFNHIPGAPDAEAGEIVTVPFTVGAKLVAAEYAEAAPEVYILAEPGEPDDIDEPVEPEEENE